MLEVSNREGSVSNVNLQLDPTPFGVGAPNKIWLVAKVMVLQMCLACDKHIEWYMHGFGDNKSMKFVKYQL